MTRTAWTLLALAGLGGTALAEQEDGGRTGGVEALALTHGSHRGISQDYLVRPSGGELSAQIRLVMSEPSLGPATEPLRLTDLGLFDISGRWSLLSKLEVSAAVTLVPKQPSYTDEKPWQSVALGLRSPLGRKVAVSLTGAGGHLLDHTGMWTREALMIEWRKPIAQVLDFGVSGGMDAITLSDKGSRSGLFSEVVVATSALFREPSGHWGGWVGVAYALPVFTRGGDPTTGMDLDPQPRLDLRLGNVLSITKEWDLFAEIAIVDRGDLSNPQTRLPILDGGFDQQQVMLGVTRHIEGPKRRNRDPLQLSRAE
ncbi:MAG: hypothetical protein JNL83_28455 [Myxococcales bacterium]|nr:hypothetical protein [Myxococcales bacterium]